MAAEISEKLLKEKLVEIESNGNHKVCVVGIIGNCALSDNGMLANQLVGKDVFHKRDNKSKKDHSQRPNEEVSIKFYHDETQRTVYLQVTSISDSSALSRSLQKVPDSISLTTWYQLWQDIELRHASALLFLFSVCHIVMVTFPTPRFDLSYIRLFKLLASIRHNMLHNLSNILSTVDDISEIWRTTGRPCIPRIIFAFQIPWTLRGRSGKDSSTTLKNVQQSLQEQVHLILKKNRLLGSLSSSSLFTVSSPNQTFVHLQQTNQYCKDPIRSCLHYLWKNSVNLDGVLNILDDRNSSSIISQVSVSPTNGYQSTTSRQEYSLQDFLYRQIDYMMTVESRDIPAEGRRGTHVEAPTASLWYRVCLALHDLFLPTKIDNNVHMKSLASSLDLDWKFSENRCRKVLPLATNAYLDNLPSHYTQSIHIAQLRQALNVFTINARGPAFEHFATQLQEDCSQIWWNGRQLCEVRSLTGQPCVYPYHQVPQQRSNSEEKQIGIPCKPHSSRVTSLVACNCGRTQATREDPFDLKTANYSFYEELEKQCCSYLTHMEFPIIADRDIPAENQCRIDINVSEDVESPIKHVYERTEENEELPDEMKGMYSNLSSSASIKLSHFSAKEQKETGSVNGLSGQGLSFGYLFPTDLSDYRDTPSNLYETSTSEAVHESDVYNLNMKAGAAQMLAGFEEHRGMPNIAYLETMLTKDTSTGLLPRFSSWSLLTLGSASGYNPSKGLEQPGFFSGTNYLLPWDIPLNDITLSSPDDNVTEIVPNNMNEASQWPAPGESKHVPGPAMHLAFSQTTSKVASLSSDLNSMEQRYTNTKGPRKGAVKSAPNTSSVKAYIGNEYECPRGHRFLCSNSDKIVKSSGYARETATRLITQDMPLYIPCRCRTSKPQHLAQLMRSFIVTPENHVTIKLNPLAHVGTDKDNAEVFCTGIKDSIILPVNSFCVLRFPYVYFSCRGPILPPLDNQALHTCKLLKGMYSFTLS